MKNLSHRLVFVHLHDDWSGPIQLRLSARDAAVLVSTPYTTPTDSLHVLGTVLRPVPSGDSLVVALYGQRALGIVDRRQASLALAAIPLPALDSTRSQSAIHVRVLANGHAMLGTRGEEAANCLRRYEVSSDTFTGCVTPRISQWPSTVDATGARFAVSTEVYDSNVQLLPKLGFDFRGTVPYSVLSPDGTSLFVNAGLTGILHFDAGTGQMLDRMPNPLSLSVPLRITRDGSTLILLQDGGTSMEIALIDLR